MGNKDFDDEIIIETENDILPLGDSIEEYKEMETLYLNNGLEI